jgi:hypothetical protein
MDTKWGRVQNFPDWIDNEIYAYNNKHLLRSNTKGYGGKTHYTYSQNSDTTAYSGRKLYHLQFSLQVASPESYGYTLVHTPYRAIKIFRTSLNIPHIETLPASYPMVHSS